MKSIITVGLSTALLTSCATIVSKSDYPVSITSHPSGCNVVVKNADGIVIHQGKTPTSVVLSAKGGYFKAASYDLEFSGKGKARQNVKLTATMDGWYAGNILFGGLIGLLVVDPLTGAMWKLEPSVNAELTPLAVIDAGVGRRIQVVDRSSLPADIAPQLVSLH